MALDTVSNVLNIQPEGVPTTVLLSQNENGRTLLFYLVGFETSIPNDATVTIAGTKPDGTVYSASGSVSSNVVTIAETVQMTAVAGVWPAKITITKSGETIAAGRIRVVIDPDPVAPGSVPSDSELEGLVAQAEQYAETARTTAYGSPLTATTVAAMTDRTRVYVYIGTETGYNAGYWYYWNGTAWTAGGIYNSVAVATDTTLTQSGVAADAKATGDALDEKIDKTYSSSEAGMTFFVGDDGEVILAEPTGITEAIKDALLALLQKVAYISDDAQDYYDALELALYGRPAVSSISAVYTPSGTVYDTDSIDLIKADLVVTATGMNGDTWTVTDYQISGSMIAGTNTYTVTYAGKSTTFTATVTWGYMLREARTFSGSQYVDTGKTIESGKMTFAAKFTVSEVAQGETRLLFGNYGGSEATYAELQSVQNWNNNAWRNFMWGMGIGYSAGADLPVINHKYAVVATCNFVSPSWTAALILRDLTSGSSRSNFSNTYTSDILGNLQTIRIGAKDTLNSATMTMHEFVLESGEWNATKIAAFLEES